MSEKLSKADPALKMRRSSGSAFFFETGLAPRPHLRVHFEVKPCSDTFAGSVDKLGLFRK